MPAEGSLQTVEILLFGQRPDSPRRSSGFKKRTPTWRTLEYENLPTRTH